MELQINSSIRFYDLVLRGNFTFMGVTYFYSCMFLCNTAWLSDYEFLSLFLCDSLLTSYKHTFSHRHQNVLPSLSVGVASLRDGGQTNEVNNEDEAMKTLFYQTGICAIFNIGLSTSLWKVFVLTFLKMAYVQAETCGVHVKVTS